MTASSPPWAGPLDAPVLRQLDQFWAFYRKILTLKALISQRLTDWHPPPDDETAAPVSAEEIAGELRPLLENWLYLAHRDAGPAVMRRTTAVDAGYLDDPVYAMSCLADEIFIHEVEWQGRDAWRQNPLELQLFHTRIGGERLFQRIERLLDRGGADQADLAAIYLWTLSLSFRGQYRGSDDGGRIAFLRKRLFALIFHRPSELYAIEPPLLPEAHAHTLDQGSGGRLRSWKAWVGYWLLSVAGVLVISALVWALTTQNLSSSLDALLASTGVQAD